MKKIVYIIASVLAIASVACSKQETTTEFVENHDPAHRTFMVDVQQTKTTIDGLAVKWAEGDKIRVYGYTKVGEDPASVGNAVFKIKSGAGSSTAVFEIEDGESLAEYDTYFAVYPSTIQFVESSLPATLEVSSSTKLNLEDQVIPDGASYDPSFGLMTAVYSESKLSFRHGVAYIKFQIPDNGITAAEVTFGANATGRRPAYTASSGDVSAVNDGVNVIKATANFIKDNWYYLPAPARSSNPMDVTITLYQGAVSQSKTTSSLTKKRLVTGEIYNLGCPPISFSATIDVEDITGVNVDGVSSSHTVTFRSAEGWTPSIQSYSGCVSAATLTSTEVISTNPSVNSINYTVSAYDAIVGNTGTIVVRLAKAGEDPIDKTINVTQSTSAAVTYKWNFTDDISSSLSQSTNGTYKYNSGAITAVDTHTETEVLYWLVSGGKKISSGSKACTADSKTYKYITYGGGASYMFFNTAASGTLYVKANVGKSVTETGSCKLGIKIDGVAGTSFDLTCYDPEKAELDMQEYSWTITNAGDSAQEIQIYKPSGSNSPWIYEIRFVTE